MANHRNPNHHRRVCPCGKQCLSRDDARHAAKALNRRQQNDGWPVDAYPCPESGTWHTGHVRKSSKRRNVERRSKGGRRGKGARRAR